MKPFKLKIFEGPKEEVTEQFNDWMESLDEKDKVEYYTAQPHLFGSADPKHDNPEKISWSFWAVYSLKSDNDPAPSEGVL